MKKLFNALLGLVAFIIIVPALIVAGLYVTVDVEALKKDISAKASMALGREIALHGPVGVDLENGLAVSVKDVTVGNPAGFKEKEFIKAGKVSVTLNWKALAERHVDIQHFIIEDASIHMITSASGIKNWEMTSPKLPELKSEVSTDQVANPANVVADNKTVAVQSNFKIERVNLNSIEVRNATLRQIDERSGKQQELQLKNASITAPFDAALNVGAQGVYNKIPFTLEFNAPGGVQELSAGKPAQIDLKADYAGQNYMIKGVYARTATTQEIKNLVAKVMGIDVTGNLALRTDGDVQLLTGNLSAPEINLTAFNKGVQKTTGKKPRPAIQSLVMVNRIPARQIVDAVVPASAPDFKALKAFNAQLNLSFAKVIFAENKSLDNVKTNLNLSGGRLRLDPFSATFLNVVYSGMLDFNPVGDAPVTHLVLNGSNIDFSALAAAFNSKSPLVSHGDIAVDMTGTGLTPEAFKNTLSGKIEMVTGKGAVDLGSSGSAGIAFIKMLYPKTQASEQQNINCGIVRFTANNGMLKSNGILFDSPLAALVGEGSVDLARDQVNLLFRHAVKDQQAGSLLNVPIKATGTLANLAFVPEQNAVIEKAMNAINGGGTTTGVPKVDPSVKGNGCVVALNDPHPVMLEQMTAKDAAKATINQAKDIIKDMGKSGGTLDKLKGLFGR